MPHLSPLSWLSAPILIWLAVLALAAHIWWTPNLPNTSSPGLDRPGQKWPW